ncbi:oxidoreductase-like domain-containing protein [Cupriavidus respiraculi]
MPPNRPDDEDCCGGGCNPCIFDYYYEEMERYRDELRAWQARHPEQAASA